MADFSSSILMFSEHPAVGAGPAGRATSSSGVSGNAGWDGSGGMDQITVTLTEGGSIRFHPAASQQHYGVRMFTCRQQQACNYTLRSSNYPAIKYIL